MISRTRTRLLPIVFLISLVPFAHAGNDLTATLSFAKVQYVLREPIYGELVVKNSKATLVNLAAAILDEGHFLIREDQGQWEQCRGTGEQRLTHGVIAGTELKAAEVLKQPFSLDVYCKDRFANPGSYEAKFVYEMKEFPADNPNHALWVGWLESTSSIIEIQKPTGIDNQAFDFQSECYSRADGLSSDSINSVYRQCHVELIDRYPNSIYATVALIGDLQQWESDWAKPSMDPGRILEALQEPDYPPARHVDGSDGKPVINENGKYVFESGKQWTQKLVDRGDIILRSRAADFYYGPRLRMGLALANIAIGRYEDARSLLDALVKDTPKSELAPDAKKYVALMKDAGLVP